jgi:hypothetical protein
MLQCIYRQYLDIATLSCFRVNMCVYVFVYKRFADTAAAVSCCNIYIYIYIYILLLHETFEFISRPELEPDNLPGKFVW